MKHKFLLLLLKDEQKKLQHLVASKMKNEIFIIVKSQFFKRCRY